MTDNLVENLKRELDILDAEGNPPLGLCVAETDADLFGSDLKVPVFRDVNMTVGQKKFCGKSVYLGDKTQWIATVEDLSSLNARSW